MIECKAGHIDLSEKAFAALAPLSRGIIPVSCRTIANPPLPAPLAFQVKSGSSRYWLALIVMNTGNAIASVQVKTAAGGWQKLAHTSWNGWIAQRGDGAGPFTIRETDSRRHQVTIGGVALKQDAIQTPGPGCTDTTEEDSARLPTSGPARPACGVTGRGERAVRRRSPGHRVTG